MSINITQITPYINYNGDAKAAIELYRAQLGAEVAGLMHWRDMPGGDVSPAVADNVMHATLKIGAAQIFLCDAPPDRAAPEAGNVSVSLEFADVEAMERSFAGMAEGGEVLMALHDAFWGGKFGMLADRYGVRWMFNLSQASAS